MSNSRMRRERASVASMDQVHETGLAGVLLRARRAVREFIAALASGRLLGIDGCAPLRDAAPPPVISRNPQRAPMIHDNAVARRTVRKPQPAGLNR